MSLIINSLMAYGVVIVLLSLAVSSVSMTISKTKIFHGIREFVEARNTWLGDLVGCPYCLSHWVAMVLVLVYRPVIVSSPIWLANFVVSVMTIVALAAFFSGMIARSILAIRSLSEQEQWTGSGQGESESENQVLRAALETAREKLLEQQMVIERLTSPPEPAGTDLQ